MLKKYLLFFVNAILIPGGQTQYFCIYVDISSEMRLTHKLKFKEKQETTLSRVPRLSETRYSAFKIKIDKS